MTEPVAYLVSQEPYSSARYILCDKPVPIDNKQVTPLYTKEQLQPKVQMTQAEFNEWKCLYEDAVELSLTSYRVLNEILYSRNNTNGKYNELSRRVYQENDSVTVSKKQAELANLFINYSPDNPEEMIEIVKDEKCFVRTKECEDGIYYVVQNTEYYYPVFNSARNDIETAKFGHEFDTKEEAEEWCNPLTEAVLLPVGDNND